MQMSGSVGACTQEPLYGKQQSPSQSQELSESPRGAAGTHGHGAGERAETPSRASGPRGAEIWVPWSVGARQGRCCPACRALRHRQTPGRQGAVAAPTGLSHRMFAGRFSANVSQPPSREVQHLKKKKTTNIWVCPWASSQQLGSPAPAGASWPAVAPSSPVPQPRQPAQSTRTRQAQRRPLLRPAFTAKPASSLLARELSVRVPAF